MVTGRTLVELLYPDIQILGITALARDIFIRRIKDFCGSLALGSGEQKHGKKNAD